MPIDYDDLPSADEQQLAHWLMRSEISAGSGLHLPRYTDTDIDRDKQRREAIRVELRRRGYSGVDVQHIESGEWRTLNGRGQEEKLDEA